MKIAYNKLVALSALLWFASASAASNPRTLAMGGAGVAAAYGKAAMLSNPAQLMSRAYSFDLGISVALQAENFKDTIDAADDLDDLIERVDCYISTCNASKKIDFSVHWDVISKNPSKYNKLLLTDNVETIIANIGKDSEQVTAAFAYDDYKDGVLTVYPQISVTESNNKGVEFANSLQQVQAKLKAIGDMHNPSSELNLAFGAAYGCLGCLNAYGLLIASEAEVKTELNVAAVDLSELDSMVKLAKSDGISVADIRKLKSNGYIEYSETVIKTIGESVDPAQQAIDQAIMDKVGASFAESKGQKIDKVVIKNPVAKPEFNNEFKDKLKSNAYVTLARKDEYGFSWAKELELDEFGINRLHVGVTPKLVKLEIAEQRFDVNSDDFDYGDFNFNSTSAFSADVGVSYKLPQSHWNFGAALRNFIPAKVSSKSGQHSAKLQPELVLGSAYNWRNLSFAADLNVLKTELIKGSGRAKQFLSIGGEVDLAGWLALRAGVAHNLAKGSIGTRLSAGIGLFSNSVQIAAYQDDDNLGAVLESAVQF